VLIRQGGELPASIITPESAYLSRRSFVAAAGGVALGALLPPGWRAPHGQGPLKPTPYEAVTTYNNYYEFGTGKDDPSKNAGSLKVSPWSVEITGEVKHTGRYAFEDLVKPYPAQERIYRHRCVEAWSMVVPWLGFPLGDLIRRLEPTSRAKFVQFTTLNDPAQMPGQRSDMLPWPYVEGLRMDEALHPLTLRAAPPGGAVEVRLQGGQGHRPHHVHGNPAHDDVEHGRAERVRVLRQREPAGGPPAVEPGPGAAHRGVLQAGHPDVQRLRRPGREPLHRHEPAHQLLSAA